MDCIFCKIVKKDISAELIYEDENSFAFLDIKPNNFGHTLLIPKKHVRNIFDFSHETLCQLMLPLQKISRAIKEGVNATGIKIIMNNEPDAGQIVFHAHFHIIPRFPNDDTRHKQYKNNEMQVIAEKIKMKLQ